MYYHTIMSVSWDCVRNTSLTPRLHPVFNVGRAGWSLGTRLRDTVFSWFMSHKILAFFSLVVCTTIMHEMMPGILLHAYVGVYMLSADGFMHDWSKCCIQCTRYKAMQRLSHNIYLLSWRKHLAAYCSMPSVATSCLNCIHQLTQNIHNNKSQWTSSLWTIIAYLEKKRLWSSTYKWTLLDIGCPESSRLPCYKLNTRVLHAWTMQSYCAVMRCSWHLTTSY